MNSQKDKFTQEIDNKIEEIRFKESNFNFWFPTVNKIFNQNKNQTLTSFEKRIINFIQNA